MKKDLTTKFKDIIKSFAKEKIAKPIIYGTIGATSIISYNASAQNVTETPGFKSAINPYSRSDTHLTMGKNNLDFYGSGDVNNDQLITYADAQAIRDGTQNYRADANGDGVKGDAADIKIIEDRVNGNGYIPATDWGHLNRQERIDWWKKYQKLETDTDQGISGWNCDNYSRQTTITLRGVQNPDEMLGNEKYFWENNGLGVIPVYEISTQLKSAEDGTIWNHRVNGFLAGPESGERYAEDPLNSDHWVFFDAAGPYQEITELKPGDGHLYNFAQVEWFGKTTTHTGYNLIHFDFPNSDGNITASIVSPFEQYLLMENPNKPTNPTGIDIFNDTHQQIDLKIQPPIGNGNVYVNITTKNPGESRLEIFDLHGSKLEDRVIYTIYGDNEKNMNFSNLPNGMYIFKAIDSKGNSDKEKIIKK